LVAFGEPVCRQEIRQIGKYQMETIGKMPQTFGPPDSLNRPRQNHRATVNYSTKTFSRSAPIGPLAQVNCRYILQARRTSAECLRSAYDTRAPVKK
jgi:hypothetical protein